MRTKGWLLAVAVWYLLLSFVAPMLVPGYDVSTHYISELGARGTPHAGLIAWAGFALLALLGAGTIVRIARARVLAGTAAVAVWLLLSEPMAYLLSAAFPCDLGCPIDGTVSQQLHNLAGVLTYPVTAVALLLFAMQPRIGALQRLLWLAVCMAWLVLFALMLAPGLEPWRGLLQRTAEWVVYGALWVGAWRLAPRVEAVHDVKGRVPALP